MSSPTMEKVRFPNPDGIDIMFARVNGQAQMGDLWEAARVARVRPQTVLQWIRRRKIEPILSGEGEMIFHLPTVAKASQVGPGRPRKEDSET
jgi:hypothetical protein